MGLSPSKPSIQSALCVSSLCNCFLCHWSAHMAFVWGVRYFFTHRHGIVASVRACQPHRIWVCLRANRPSNPHFVCPAFVTVFCATGVLIWHLYGACATSSLTDMVLWQVLGLANPTAYGSVSEQTVHPIRTLCVQHL